MAGRLNVDYWRNDAVKALENRIGVMKKIGLDYEKNRKIAKNIILFIGDGHGVTSFSATRKLKENKSKTQFYQTSLSSDEFPFSGFSKVIFIIILQLIIQISLNSFLKQFVF